MIRCEPDSLVVLYAVLLKGAFGVQSLQTGSNYVCTYILSAIDL